MTVCARIFDNTHIGNSNVLAKLGSLEARIATANELAAIFGSHASNERKSNGSYIGVFEGSTLKKAIAYCRLVRSDDCETVEDFGSAKTFGSDVIISLNPHRRFLEISPFIFLSPKKKHRVNGLLWQAVAFYSQLEQIDYVMGCLPMSGKYPAYHAIGLSYLYHNYRAQPDLLAKAKAGVSMDIMPPEAIKPEEGFASLPPMLRYCLRHGGRVGDGVVVDRAAEQINLFVIVPMKEKGATLTM